MNARWQVTLIGFMAVGIWARLPGDSKPETPKPETVLTYEQANGKALFATYCSICHGAAGEGDGFNAFNLNPRPRNLADRPAMAAFTDDQLYEAIARGGGKRGKSNLMPPWGYTLNQRQIRYLVAYLRR